MMTVFNFVLFGFMMDDLGSVCFGHLGIHNCMYIDLFISLFLLAGQLQATVFPGFHCLGLAHAKPSGLCSHSMCTYQSRTSGLLYCRDCCYP